MLIVQESLAAKRHERDYGLILGAKLTTWIRQTFNPKKRQRKTHGEHEPLLANQKSNSDEEAAPDLVQNPEEAPSMRDVLSYQTTLNLIVYTFLAFNTLAYDQVFINTLCKYYHC